MAGTKQTIDDGEQRGSYPYEFEIAGDTVSVGSSITQYRIENGRSYHAYKDGVYWAPNDERQNEALDINHHKYLLVLGGKLFLAPLKKDIKLVLDIGTGTGIWAIDFADEFPQTTVSGTDLSPIQPALVPPNCIFEVDDARDLWTYPDNYFDFIHIRGLFGSISDWLQLYKQAYRHLKPGGYIEQLEISIDMKSEIGIAIPLIRFAELFTEFGEITGQSFRIADTMRDTIKEAGFVNVVEKVFETPLGSWPADPTLQEIGQYSLLGFDIGLEGYVVALLTRVLGWNITEVHVLLAQIRNAVRDQNARYSNDVKVVYGQKPLPATTSAVAPRTWLRPAP